MNAVSINEVLKYALKTIFWGGKNGKNYKCWNVNVNVWIVAGGSAAVTPPYFHSDIFSVCPSVTRALPPSHLRRMRLCLQFFLHFLFPILLAFACPNFLTFFYFFIFLIFEAVSVGGGHFKFCSASFADLLLGCFWHKICVKKKENSFCVLKDDFLYIYIQHDYCISQMYLFKTYKSSRKGCTV